MATGEKNLWLKVLIGFIISIMTLALVMGASQLDKKVNKEVFELHETYQNEQFTDIKDSLDRIEEKL
jgi:hypothetical protein